MGRSVMFIACLLPMGCLESDDSDAPSAGAVYYVAADTAAEMSAPSGTSTVLNRVYRGQRVEVFDQQDGWARVTSPEFEARWIEMSRLSTEKPAEIPQPGVPRDLQDSRIAPSAIPEVGQHGLTEAEVLILWRGAKHMVSSGRCSTVDYADKSTSRSNTYFVTCGNQNVFFTPQDLPAR